MTLHMAKTSREVKRPRCIHDQGHDEAHRFIERPCEVCEWIIPAIETHCEDCRG